MMNDDCMRDRLDLCDSVDVVTSSSENRILAFIITMLLLMAS